MSLARVMHESGATSLDDPQAVLDRSSTKLRALRQAHRRHREVFSEGNRFVTGPPLPEEHIRRVE